MSILADPTFIGLRADAWAAIGAWIGAAITVGLLIYAARQLKDARELRDEQTRPFVIVDFHARNVMIGLAVINVGQTAAVDVRVQLNEEMTTTLDGDHTLAWQHSGVFAEGLPSLAPGREMQFLLDMYDRRMKAGLPMKITGTVRYWRPHRRGEELVETFVIDLAPYAHALMAPKDVSDLVDEVEKLREVLKKAVNAATDRS